MLLTSQRKKKITLKKPRNDSSPNISVWTDMALEVFSTSFRILPDFKLNWHWRVSEKRLLFPIQVIFIPFIKKWGQKQTRSPHARNRLLNLNLEFRTLVEKFPSLLLDCNPSEHFATLMTKNPLIEISEQHKKNVDRRVFEAPKL